jgi:DNA-binding response OmpR family regulator
VSLSLILLVYHSEDMVATFAAPLAFLGYGVLAVCGMDLATQDLQSHRPHLALLDCRLGPRDLMRARSTLAEGFGVPVAYVAIDGSRPDTGPAGVPSDAECLVPPFTAESLQEKIRRHIERAVEAPVRTLQIDDICINPERGCVCRAGAPVYLTHLELGLLTELLSRPGMVLTTMDLAQVWGQLWVTYGGLAGVLHRIRKKLGQGEAWKIHQEKDNRCWLERMAGCGPVGPRAGQANCPRGK